MLGRKTRFHSIFMLRWLWGSRECGTAHCSYYKYQTVCKREDGYIWKPGESFLNYSFSPCPIPSFLDTTLCSAAEWGRHSRTESGGCVRRRLRTWPLGAEDANEGSCRSVVSSTFCFFDFPLVVLLCLRYRSIPRASKASPGLNLQGLAEKHSFLL